MLVIRFRRQGKKNKPTYRVVVAEHSWPINGKFVDELGAYNPHTKAASLNKERAVEWMNKGAKPSNSVSRLFDKEKIKHNLVEYVAKNKKSKQAVEQKAAAAVTAAAPEADAAEEATTEAEVATEETPEVSAEEPTTDAPETTEAETAPAAEEPAVEAAATKETPLA